MNTNDMILLYTRATESFAQRVAEQLAEFRSPYESKNNIHVKGEVKFVQFADGEIEVELLDTVRGKDVYLLANAGRNSRSININEAKIEIYHVIDAIRRSGAHSIILIEPYYTASRSDRTTRRNSVGFWIHYKILSSLGVDHIVTLQLHSDKSRTAVDPVLCLIDDVPLISLIQEYLAFSIIKNKDYLHNHVQENWLFCAVDIGGEMLVKQCAQAFGTNLIVAHKKRNYTKVNHVESIRILSSTPLENKDVWIVDDMIDTASSIVTLIEELVKQKVASVNIAIVHPVFSDPAIARLQKLHKQGYLQQILTTNTIEITPDIITALPFLHIIPIEKRCAEIILRIHNNQSLTSLSYKFNAAKAFDKNLS